MKRTEERKNTKSEEKELLRREMTENRERRKESRELRIRKREISITKDSKRSRRDRMKLIILRRFKKISPALLLHQIQ